MYYFLQRYEMHNTFNKFPNLMHNQMCNVLFFLLGANGSLSKNYF